MSLYLPIFEIGTVNIKQANEKLGQVDIQGLWDRDVCIGMVADLTIGDPYELRVSDKLLVQIGVPQANPTRPTSCLAHSNGVERAPLFALKLTVS